MIEKVPNNISGFDIKITDKEGNSFFMIFGGNFDLFWVSEGEKLSYIIDVNSDELLYKKLNNLWSKIENANIIFTSLDEESTFKNNTLSWVSEDRPAFEANRLVISKTDDKFLINFIRNENNFFPRSLISVCFCNSGSNYPEVSQEFMKLYLSLIDENYNYEIINKEKF